MKKILFLIKTLNIGGAERVLVDISNHLAAAGYEVTVQTLLDEGKYRDMLSKDVVYRRGLPFSSLFMQKIFLRLLMILPPIILGNLLIRRKYTHVVGFTEGLPTKIIGGYLSNKSKKIAWVHTDLYMNYASGNVFATARRNRACYDSFDRVVCVSKDAKKGYERRIGQHKKEVIVQYNPLDKAEIIRKSNEIATYPVTRNEGLNLVAVGRLEEVKGFDLLIEAMGIVRNSINQALRLYIIGDGSQNESLDHLIDAYGLKDVVHLCGSQINPYSIMRKCDLQIIPSRAEGYPLVLCEGHFLGLPVVSTKCTGPTEIIEDSKGGILVDISAAALADGIIKMVNDKALFNKCKEEVIAWSERYDENEVYRQIESIFD